MAALGNSYQPSGLTDQKDQLIPESNTGPGVIETSSGAVAETPIPKTEIGEQVTHGEILQFAKRKCNLCTGTGVITKVHISPGVPDTYSKQICGCASLRFEKKMQKQILQKTEKVTNPRTGRTHDQFLGWYWKIGTPGNARAIIRKKMIETLEAEKAREEIPKES